MGIGDCEMRNGDLQVGCTWAVEKSPSTKLLLLRLLTNYYCMGTVPFKQVVLFWTRVVEGGSGGVQQGGTQNTH